MKHSERQNDSGPLSPASEDSQPTRPPSGAPGAPAAVAASLYRVAPWLRQTLPVARGHALRAARKAGSYARAALLGKIGMAVVATILALVVVLNAVVAYSSVRTVSDHDFWVSHSNAVLAQVGALTSALDNAVAGVRGYVITGDTSYLQPYNQARQNITGEVTQLQTLTNDNSLEAKRIVSLRSLISTQMSNLQSLVSLRQANQTDQAIRQVEADTGKDNLDAIHALVVKMRADENSLLHSRDASAAAALRATKVTIVLAALLDLILLGAVLWLLRKAMTLREEVTAERLRMESRTQVLALEQTNQRMNEFLSVAGHELRSPLTAAKMNVDMMARQLQDMPSGPAGSDAGHLDHLRDLLGRTLRQMKRQDRLVTDLLDLSRIQTAKLELRPDRCDLARIVREAVDDQRALNTDRTISLSLSGPAETAPIWVLADEDRIGQVISNYLTNALKYSPAEAPVAVTLEGCGHGARVAVRDEGPGLPPEEHQHIWERFQRAEGVEVLSGTGVGLGLGLYISKSIIERHDGEVGLISAPGDGATFWFSLPLDADDATAADENISTDDDA